MYVMANASMYSIVAKYTFHLRKLDELLLSFFSMAHFHLTNDYIIGVDGLFVWNGDIPCHRCVIPSLLPQFFMFASR